MINIIKKHCSYESLQELIRFGFVGVATNLIGYVIYLLITSFGFEPKKVMSIMYFVGAIMGFLGNRQWTFKSEGYWLGTGIRYSVAHLMGYLLNLGILIIFVDNYHYSHQWVQGVAIFVVAGFLFITFKFFVFPKSNAIIRGDE